MFDSVVEKARNAVDEIDFVVHFGVLPKNPNALFIVTNTLAALDELIDGPYGSDMCAEQVADANRYWQLAERFQFVPTSEKVSKSA